ncbi:50S ribosomal protein L11 methyltransferase [Nitratifractor salsuginis]|uniref:Ribosomal protein L11 methyltransferase n=1 Tax=Nitratifractor salsuginis (strain DSM 16511 / JCM 12458 / E9I37-1) TaxID=749222 RepID=E6X171_NITSE|nr:50S ribosomal protein L11 methyltransferase [Nitratifractor salsuginis]ADV46933.1 (LSU ribosomal protein L11P)-lysine N-methyltransferase [Nitratifractor salsuginis DSM 16511]
MKERYSEVTFVTDSAYVDLLADFIGTVSNEAIEYGEDRIILRTEQDTGELIDKVRAMVREISNDFPLEISEEEKENVDWIQAYQDSVQPIEAGPFYIHPEWYPPKEEKINILINPALAFGSGHHATTYSCLEAIAEYVTPQDRLLDVGCGSGILALAARKLGATVELCDTDPLAVESAAENFRLNDERFEKIWEGSAHKTDQKYTVVVANIIADVLKAIAPQLKARMEKDSLLILSGILDKKEAIVSAAFQDLELLERKQRDEWVTLIYTNKKDVNG